MAVRKRLTLAVQLIRSERTSLAAIASATGFVDQSHLTNWVRRVYGISPGRLACTVRTGAPGRRTSRGQIA